MEYINKLPNKIKSILSVITFLAISVLFLAAAAFIIKIVFILAIIGGAAWGIYKIANYVKKQVVKINIFSNTKSKINSRSTTMYHENVEAVYVDDSHTGEIIEVEYY